MRTIYAVVYTDSSGTATIARLSDKEAVKAGGELARRVWPGLDDGEEFPEDEVTGAIEYEGVSDTEYERDTRAMDMLRNFEDVSIEIEEIELSADIIRELARGLDDA